MKQPQELLPEDEMSLADLWQMLVAGWRLILGGVAAALAVADIYLAITPRHYEATLVVRVGQVGVAGLLQQKAGRVGVAGMVQQVESVEDAIGWMRGSGFMDAVVESLGWKGDERERLFKYSFQVTSPNDKYLQIRLYGLSRDTARRAAEACVAVLADRHRRLADEIVATRNRKFANLVADIADAEVFLHRIESLGKSTSPNDRDQGVNWLQTVKDEKSRLRDLRMHESEMKESMKAELNTQTMAAESIVISSLPVHPKTRRVWVFAAIGGLFLGVLLVSLRSTIRMNKKNCPPVT
ncbi:MAG: hypothetical protein K9J74_00420 [Sulfuritalea sp.]|nr:hypothetical protein [Sulfuritalea sp.]